MDIPAYIWLPVYFNSMFAIARNYNSKDKNCNLSMYKYFQSLSNILPNKVYRNYFKKFLSFDDEVVKTLLSLDILNSFFTSHVILKEALIKNPQEFLNQCFENTNLMFIYVYLMFTYMLFIQKSLGYNIHFPTYFDLQKMYDPNNLTKADWGRPTWFVIHISALYSPQDSKMVENYKNFLESLQYILPCTVCQEHLRENIKFVNFTNCGPTNKDLFKCSWELHNIVNRSLNKYTPSLEEALNFYSIETLKKNSPYSYSIMNNY